MRCELGYYGKPFLDGGNCSLCQCNNNSDICNRENGSCLEHCENNSTGWHCERCENGTYGDATKQQCQGEGSAIQDIVNMAFVSCKSQQQTTVCYLNDIKRFDVLSEGLRRDLVTIKCQYLAQDVESFCIVKWVNPLAVV